VLAIEPPWGWKIKVSAGFFWLREKSFVVFWQQASNLAQNHRFHAG
jgi:hypothetical protein